MSTLYTFWDNITPNRIESLHLGGLMNSATISTGQVLDLP